MVIEKFRTWAFAVVGLSTLISGCTASANWVNYNKIVEKLNAELARIDVCKREIGNYSVDNWGDFQQKLKSDSNVRNIVDLCNYFTGEGNDRANAIKSVVGGLEEKWPGRFATVDQCFNDHYRNNTNPAACLPFWRQWERLPAPLRAK